MSEVIAQGSALRVVFKLLNSTSHAPVTEATVAVSVSKNGGPFGALDSEAANATEIANGWYYVDLQSGDTNTPGPLILLGTAVSCDDVGVDMRVGAVPADLIRVDGLATNDNLATLKLKQLNVQNSSGSAVLFKSTADSGIGLEIEASAGDDQLGIKVTALGNSNSGKALSLHSGSDVMTLHSDVGKGLVIATPQSGVSIDCDPGPGIQVTAHDDNGVSINGNGNGMAISGTTATGLVVYGGNKGMTVDSPGSGIEVTAGAVVALGISNSNGDCLGLTSAGGSGVSLTSNATGVRILADGTAVDIDSTASDGITIGAASGNGLLVTAGLIGLGITSDVDGLRIDAGAVAIRATSTGDHAVNMGTTQADKHAVFLYGGSGAGVEIYAPKIVSNIAELVWEELRADHTTPGTYGEWMPANVLYVNSLPVGGSGTTLSPWGPA